MSWDKEKEEVLDPVTGNFFPWARCCRFYTCGSAMQFLSWNSRPPMPTSHEQPNISTEAIPPSTLGTISTITYAKQAPAPKEPLAPAFSPPAQHPTPTNNS
eukprot:13592603-Ditylum_brightwellii.AAC.1